MALRTHSVLPSSLCVLIAIVAWGFPLSCLRADDDGAKLAVSSSAATRTLPLNCPAGEPIRVGIEVNPASEVLVYAVEDTSPTGWVIIGINEGGIFDESTGKVKWGPFFDNQSRSLSYMATPPSGWSGIVEFSGSVSLDGIGSTIEGDRQCRVAPATLPVIDLQPVSQRVGLGSDVTFGVSATGSGALSYQWTKDGSDLPGETGAFLSLIGVAELDAGEYRVAVTDSQGTTLSDGARLVVSLSTAVRSLPESFSAGVLGSISIVVGPEGGVLSYAVEETPPVGWTIGTINEGGVYDVTSGTVKWGPFFDAQSRTLSYEAAAPPNGPELASFQGIASFDGLSVAIGGAAQRPALGGKPPTIDTQPMGQFAILGNEVTFCVSAMGSGALSYQWSKDGSDLPGATSPCLRLERVGQADSGDYRVAVTDSRGTIISQVARLTVALSSATRTLPERCLEGAPIQVTIDARPEVTVLSYAVEETPPAGWVIEAINEGGVYDPTTGTVKWGPFFDAQPRTLTYEGTAPVGAGEMGAFSGVASFDGASVPITGDTQCRVAPSACLDIRLRDGFVVIEFCKPKLYSADSVTGPFKEIIGATSPYLAPITDTEKFFLATD